MPCLSCLILSCLALSCLVVSCLVLSCLALSWLVWSGLVMACLVLSCLDWSLVCSSLVLSWLVCLVLFCLVLSFVSCLVLSSLFVPFLRYSLTSHRKTCPVPCCNALCIQRDNVGLCTRLSANKNSWTLYWARSFVRKWIKYVRIRQKIAKINYVQTIEVRFCRRMMRKRWTEKSWYPLTHNKNWVLASENKTINIVRESNWEVETWKRINETVGREQQSILLGRVMGRWKLEKAVSTEKLEGKRRSGNKRVDTDSSAS